MMYGNSRCSELEMDLSLWISSLFLCGPKIKLYECPCVFRHNPLVSSWIFSITLPRFWFPASFPHAISIPYQKSAHFCPARSGKQTRTQKSYAMFRRATAPLELQPFNTLPRTSALPSPGFAWFCPTSPRASRTKVLTSCLRTVSPCTLGQTSRPASLRRSCLLHNPYPNVSFSPSLRLSFSSFLLPFSYSAYPTYQHPPFDVSPPLPGLFLSW